MLAMIFMQATEIPMMKQNNTYTKHTDYRLLTDITLKQAEQNFKLLVLKCKLFFCAV